MPKDDLKRSDKQNGRAQDFEPGSGMLIGTHGELKQFVMEVQKDKGWTKGAINNAKTAFNGFLKSRGLKDDSPIDGLFDDEDQFEINLMEYDKYLIRKGNSETTRASYISLVRDYRKVYELRSEKKLPDTFDEALLSLITRAGFTIFGFWRSKVKPLIAAKAFRNWCMGIGRPSVNSIKVISKLEEILDVEEGTLLNRLPRVLHGGRQRPTGLTSYGRKMQEALRNKYGKWTPTLQEQFEQLTAQMSSAARPEGFARSATWTSSDGADIPHADIVQNYLRSFFGFCCLPKAEPDPYRNDQVKKNERATAYMSGRGMDDEKMSLALLAVKPLVVTYLEFQRVRAGGVYTMGHVNFIAMVRLLLRPGYGYIYQHPEFASHLEGVIEADRLSWHERCVLTRDRLLEIRKDWEAGNCIEYGRDPTEPIQPILDLEQPLSVMFLMLEAIKKDMPPVKSSILLRAEHYRN